MSRYYCPITREVEDDYFANYCCDKPERHSVLGRRWWFYRPQVYWQSWKSLLPVGFGFDEYGRKVCVLGWSVTGKICLALWLCHCEECEQMRAQTAEWEYEERVHPDPAD